MSSITHNCLKEHLKLSTTQSHSTESQLFFGHLSASKGSVMVLVSLFQTLLSSANISSNHSYYFTPQQSRKFLLSEPVPVILSVPPASPSQHSHYKIALEPFCWELRRDRRGKGKYLFPFVVVKLLPTGQAFHMATGPCPGCSPSDPVPC